MLRFAQQQFQLDAREQDGSTTRETLEAYARNNPTAPLPVLLEEVECDLSVRYIFDYWKEVSKLRQLGMELSPISWPELESWKNLKRITLTPWEVDTLTDIEAIYISIRRGSGGLDEPDETT